MLLSRGDTNLLVVLIAILIFFFLFITFMSVLPFLQNHSFKWQQRREWLRLTGREFKSGDTDELLCYYAHGIQGATNITEARQWKEKFTKVHALATALGEPPTWSTVREYQHKTPRRSVA